MIQTRSKTIKNNICPCGGGQSCIVDRRRIGDWVLEDYVFRKNNLSLRKNCFAPYSRLHYEYMKNFYNKEK